MANDFGLQDRTTLLMGPFNGVQRALALQFTQFGADVVLASSDTAKAQHFVQQINENREINEHFGRCGLVPLRAQTASEARDMVSRAAEIFGGIDVFIEEAELGSQPCRFADLNLDTWERGELITLASTIYASCAVVHFLRGRKRGRIIYLLQDLMEWGQPNFALACAARSGLPAFSRTLARELSEFNITVNCINQGVTEEFVRLLAPGSDSAQMALSEVRKEIPGLQLTEPERIVNVAMFLAGSRSAGLTGQCLSVKK